MIIEELRVINFRNYKDIHLKFHPRLNIFVGNNAQGKTNLLEAIYLCAVGRSFRTNRDNEMINIEKQQAYVRVKLKKKYGDVDIEIRLSSGHGKDAKVNNICLTKIGELLGNLNVVLFSPEDLKLIKGGPGERRKFMDREISQIFTRYYYILGQYNKILRHRNRLLKDSRKRNLDLEVWNEQLAMTGAWIIFYRRNFIKRINLLARLMHRKVTGSAETLEIIYDSDVEVEDNDRIDQIKGNMLKKLENSINTDKKRGLTTTGPHRDDIILMINGLNAKNYGSQGQQRTVVLSLKLAEIELIKGEVGEYPVLLLDDVMSELDSERQNYLISNLKNVQTFITTAITEHIKEMGWKDKVIFNISKGQIG
ncbi:MAG: DNA replication/repair protein RecF [Candidatus Alkaliphilus sp. MAG34]|nr:DNA replication/repair protein RecF [Clostridiales bacterium]